MRDFFPLRKNPSNGVVIFMLRYKSIDILMALIKKIIKLKLETITKKNKMNDGKNVFPFYYCSV